MNRSRKLIREGLRDNSSWRLGLGVGLGIVHAVRKATRPQPEVVARLKLEPGERVTIETRDPVPRPEGRSKRKREK